MLTQLVSYLVHLAHLDLGYSTRFGMPVLPLILERLPNTMVLMLSALGMALGMGILAGWIMAIFAGRWPDRILQVVVLLFYSTPGFWIGLMAIVLFSVKLGWLPSNGSMTASCRSAQERTVPLRIASPPLASTVTRLASISTLRRNAFSISCCISAAATWGCRRIKLLMPLIPLIQ